jgi:hypothetical protein
MRHTARLGPLAAALISVASLGCEGEVSDARPLPSGGNAGDESMDRGGQGAASSGPSDDEMKRANPTLFETALDYFPTAQAAGGPKRLVRLTRTQLDLTTQLLLPGHGKSTAAATMPRDPL